MDGVMDISGPYIRYTKKEPEEETAAALPYTIAEITEANPLVKFFNFLASIIPDNETAATAFHYLSLIIAKHTEFKYGGIFIGPPGTGKTALLKLLSRALPGYINFLPISRFPASPIDLAGMDGMGAAVIQEIEVNSQIKAADYKTLISSDTLTARRLYQTPYNFTPTAQIILVNNCFPRFDFIDDEALAARVLIIPFLIPHRRGAPGTMPFQRIVENLQAEFPAIVKLLADYYVRLKHKFNGVIPLSKQCKDLKKHYFRKPFYLKCDYCMKHFAFQYVVIENNQLHCPCCGTVIKTAQAHVSRRGK
jgi:phage/plasmid-associated DNA primase